MKRRLASLLVLAAACQSGTRSPPPAAKEVEQSARDAGAVVDMPQRRVVRTEVATLPEPPIELPRQESFKLLAPGAAPRKPLRYRWRTGDVELATEAHIRSRQLSGGAWSEVKQLPPLREAFAATFSGSGDTTVLVRGLPASTDAGDLGARWKALIENKRATVAIDARGQLGKLTLPEDPVAANPKTRTASDEILQRWLTAVVPLPDAPVGKGARWRVVTVLRAGEAIIKQTAEYTLVEARRDAWVIDVLSRRVGEEQTMAPAGMPRGTLAELVALFRELRGRLTVNPALPWPRGTLDAELRVHGRLAIPGQPIAEQLTEDIGTLELSATVSPATH